MKSGTKQFIIWLIERELTQEIVNDNININEVDYVKDLINSSKDFVSCYGEFEDNYNIRNLISQLENK